MSTEYKLNVFFQIQKEDESILSWTFGHDAAVGYILSLGVLESYRGLGLGTLTPFF